MCNPRKLLTIHETAELLHLNPEVLRRWLREGKMAGTKVGSDWRIPESVLESIMNPAHPPAPEAVDSGPKMCIKFPKWLEFSGLPGLLNAELGPMAWPVFKKLIELDFEQGEQDSARLRLDFPRFCDRLGYGASDVRAVLKGLARQAYITFDARTNPPEWVKIQIPIKTPRSILDIGFAEGGVKGAPEKAFDSRCLRRYLV